MTEKIILECYNDRVLIIRSLDNYYNTLKKEMEKTEVNLLHKTLENEMHFVKRVKAMIK